MNGWFCRIPPIDPLLAALSSFHLSAKFGLIRSTISTILILLSCWSQPPATNILAGNINVMRPVLIEPSFLCTFYLNTVMKGDAFNKYLMYVMNEQYDSHSKLSLIANWICDQITCQNILDTQYYINEIWSEIKKRYL